MKKKSRKLEAWEKRSGWVDHRKLTPGDWNTNILCYEAMLYCSKCGATLMINRSRESYRQWFVMPCDCWKDKNEEA